MNRLTRYTDNLFFVFLFILPFQTVYLWREPIMNGAKWQYGTIGIYLSSLIVAVAIMLGAIMKANALKKKTIIDMMTTLWHERKSDMFLLLFVLWSGLSILWAQDTALALYTFVKILLAADVFVMTRDLVRRGKMKRIVVVLFVAAAIQSVIGIGQFLTQDSFSSKVLGMSAYESWQAGTSVLKNESGRFLRAYGSFSHPNVYGLFLAVVLILVVSTIGEKSLLFPLFQRGKLLNVVPSSKARFLFIKNWKTSCLPFKNGVPSLRGDCVSPIALAVVQGFCSRTVTFFGILIILLGLIMSFSRLAWGGFALGFIFLAWRSISDIYFCHPGLDPGSTKKNILDSGSKAGMTGRYPLAIFATIVISTVIFTGILHETVFPRFDGGVVDRDGSVVDRMSTYRDAFQIVRAHPLLGVGAGNETAELIRISPHRPIWDIQPSHDVPLLILTELGIPGLVLALCFFWFSLFPIVKTKTPLGDGRAPVIVILLILIPSLLLDHFLWDSNFGLMFVFILLGLTFDTNYRLKRP